MKKIILFFVLISISWSVKAQIVTIPDIYFKNMLLTAGVNSHRYAKDLNGSWTVVDTNQDGEIQKTEAENILELKVSFARIEDLTGIEAFVNLTKLNCSRNRLSSIKINTLPNIKEFDCSFNTITNLDLTNNVQLEILKCRSNRLTSLNVDVNVQLRKLSFQNNFINTINVSNNTNLSELSLGANPMSTINVSNNTSLVKLSCELSTITTLNLTNNTLLKILECNNTDIANLDISNNTQLLKLSCKDTNISNLDLSANSLLTFLDFRGTSINTINISNLLNLTYLNCSNTGVSTIDLSANTVIRFVNCSGTNITSLDLSNNIELDWLICNNLNLANLDLTNNTNLSLLHFINTNITQLTDITGLTTGITDLNCSGNNFTELDVSNFTNLSQLRCSSNNLTTLDLGNNINLISLDCRDNPNLTYINLKNGNNSNINLNNTYATNFTNLPSLETVCIDEINGDLSTTILNQTGHSVTFTKYCSLIPTQSNQISGNVKFDMDNNGCDVADFTTPNIMLTSNNGTETFATFTQNDGNYLLFTNEGDFTTEITTNLPSYFTVNPNTHTNNFTGFNNTYTADFCIEPNQAVDDLNITLLPTSAARPNLETGYTLVYKNVGTTVLNGNINLVFNDNLLDFISASESVSTQTINNITFNYSNLNPFETRKINIVFKVATNATINDNLDFTTTIYPVLNDYSASDNTFVLNQTIVNSYDPNDIHVLEGSSIKMQEAQNYLHYLIRFQNTGTAEAINIIVANELEAKLDWNTLQLEATSHNMRVAIKNGNNVEFIFKNINLPDKTTNEKESHGYIAYKIKLKNNVSAGNIILNQAKIFFDYNAAIDTNIAATRIIDNLVSVNDTKLLDAVLLYPNPIKERINIKAKTTIVNVAIYSKLGQLILSKSNDNIEQIDISKLTKGMYVIKLLDNNGGSAIKKFVKY